MATRRRRKRSLNTEIQHVRFLCVRACVSLFPWSHFLCLYSMCGLSFICVWEYTWASETQSSQRCHQRYLWGSRPWSAQAPYNKQWQQHTALTLPERQKCAWNVFLCIFSLCSHSERWIPRSNLLKLNSFLLCCGEKKESISSSHSFSYHACNLTCQLCSVGQPHTTFSWLWCHSLLLF